MLRLGICAFSMEEVIDQGVHNVLKECLKVVDPTNDRQLHLSFDIDAMDPSIAPATGTPVPKGLMMLV